MCKYHLSSPLVLHNVHHSVYQENLNECLLTFSCVEKGEKFKVNIFIMWNIKVVGGHFHHYVFRNRLRVFFYDHIYKIVSLG